MPNLRSLLLCCAIACSSACFSPLVSARSLTVCVPEGNLPPFIFRDKEGQAQWLIREAVEQQGDQLKIERAPFRRCITGASEGRYDAAAPTGASADLLGMVRFPMLKDLVDPSRALGAANLVAVRRVGTQAEWDGQHFKNLATPVLITVGLAAAKEKLAQLGVPIDEGQGGMTVSQSLQKLAAGRGDIAIASEAVAIEQLAQDEFRGRLEILAPPFYTGSIYLVFGPRFQSENPAYPEAIWKAIKQLRASDKFKKLTSGPSH